MNRRNFKVRIKNSSLKNAFSLEHSPNEHAIFLKYDALLTKQGYCMVTHKTDGKTKIYTYYPQNLEIKHRKEHRAKNRTKTGKPRRNRNGMRIIRARPPGVRTYWRKPEYMVSLEITMLYPTAKYKL